MRKRFFTILITLSILAMLTASVFAGGVEEQKNGDQLIFGETYILEEDMVLDGNLVAINSIVIIKENALVTGDIILINSSINLNAEVYGSLISFSGTVNLFEEARIHGDLMTPGAETFHAVGSEVLGKVMTSELNEVNDIEYFNDIESLLNDVDLTNDSNSSSWFNNFDQNSVMSPLARGLWIIFSSFIVSVVAAFVVLAFRNRIKNVSATIRNNSLESGGFGLATMFVIFPIIFVIFGILAITIILLPISLLVYVLMALITFVGWVMGSIEIGRIILKSLKQEWSEPIIAGIGAFVMNLIIMILNLIFWGIVGSILGLVITSVGVGALLLSKFGSTEYSKK